MQVSCLSESILSFNNILTYHFTAGKPPPPPDTTQDEWDVPKVDDWYKSRSVNFKRSEILMIAFIAKDHFRLGKVLTREQWVEGLVDAQNKGFNRVQSLEGSQCEKVREMVKYMAQKCKKDAAGFNNFLMIANKGLWRMDATENRY